MLCLKAFEEMSISLFFLVFIHSFAVFKVFQIDISTNDKIGKIVQQLFTDLVVCHTVLR